MAQRQLVIARPALSGKKASTCMHVNVDDRAQIGPWIMTLAGHLGYPLADSFGAPIAYQLRSVFARKPLPTTGRFADVRFPADDCFVLEPNNHQTVQVEKMGLRRREPHRASIVPARFSRRFLMGSALLTTCSLFGFGTGMTSAFAQYLLRQPHEATSQTLTAASPFTLSLRRTLTQHRQTIRTLTWAPDESMLASGGDDALALIWQLNGSLVHTLQFDAPVSAIAWSPDGEQIVTAHATTVSFFQAPTGQLLAEESGHHTASVTTLGWTGTPMPLAISAGHDKTAIVWSGQSHLPQVIFRQHTTAIEALAILAGIVATASQGGVTRVWNALSGQEIHGYYTDTPYASRAIAFSSTGQLAIGGDDHVIRLWQNGRSCMHQAQDLFGLRCLDEPRRLQRHIQPVHALAFSPDGTLLASGGDDKNLIIWSVQSLTPVLIQPQHEALTALAWSPSGQFLAGAIGSRILLWQRH